VYAEPLVGATPQQINTGLVFGAANGTFTAPNVETIGYPRAFDTVATVADFTGDGIPDYVFAVSRSANGDAPVCVATGTGNGNFNPAVPCTTFAITGAAVADFAYIAAAPFTTNGQQRLWLEDKANGAVYFLRYASGFQLVSRIALSASDGPGPFLTADVDGDGNTDFIVLNQTTHVVTVYGGHGDGSFTAGTPCTLTGGIFSMLVQDIDGDGHPDLIVEGTGGALSVFMGSASGFSRTAVPLQGAQNGATGNGGHLVGIADMNGDGILDVVTSTAAGISVLLGHGSLTYTLDRVYSTGGAGNAIFAFADFNGDGIPDVAIGSPTGLTILLAQAGAPPAGSVSATPEPSMYGASFTLTANFTVAAGAPSPTGTVTFAIDGSTVGTGVISGNSATYTLATPTILPGAHTLTASFPGDANYSSMTFTGSHTVTQLRSATVFTITTPTIFYGQIADGQATVSEVDSAPGVDITGGTVTFYDGSTVICVLPSGVPATCPASAGAGLNAGTHILTATYSGNTYYSGSSGSGTVLVQPDPTACTLTSSLNPSPFGQPVTLTTVATAPYATPTGTVFFYDGGPSIGSAALNGVGVATLTTSTLAAGTHNIASVLAASLNFLGCSTNTVTQVVKAVGITTTTTLTSSLNPSALGQSITLTATVVAASGQAVGNVNFYDSGNLLAVVPLNASGVATFTTSALALGTHNLFAQYEGTLATQTPYLLGSNAMIAQVVAAALPMGFTLTVSPTTVPVPIGSSVSVLVTVTATGGFAQPVALACIGLTRASTCTFSQTTIPAGGGTTRLAVFATAPHNCTDSTPYFTASGPTTLFGLFLSGTLILLVRRRRRMLATLAVLAVFAMLTAATGCGHCTDLGVRPGSYSFAVTGTSTGSPSQTQTVGMEMDAHL
jgi:hypothetical protein